MTVTVNYDRSYLKVKGEVQEMNRAFQADIRKYQHKQNHKTILISLKPYTLPFSISKMVDIVTGFSYFPIENLISTKNYKIGNIAVGPAQLRQRYNVTGYGGLSPQNSQAVAEFQDQYYSPSGKKKKNFTTKIITKKITKKKKIYRSFSILQTICFLFHQ